MCMARWYQKLSTTYTASLFLFEVSALSNNKTLASFQRYWLLTKHGYRKYRLASLLICCQSVWHCHLVLSCLQVSRHRQHCSLVYSSLGTMIVYLSTQNKAITVGYCGNNSLVSSEHHTELFHI